MGDIEGADRIFLVIIGSRFCKSYEITLAMLKLISSDLPHIFLLFALKCTDFFLPTFFFFFEIFFVKNLKDRF